MLSRAGLRRAFDLLPDATLLVTDRGEVLEASESACRLFGTARSELIGSPLEDLLENPRRLAGFLERGSRSSEGVPGSLRLRGGEALAIWGGVIEPASETRPATLLFRARSAEESQFALLNRQLDRMNREIGRRVETERRLRQQEVSLEEQLRLAAFARDVALAVSESTAVEPMLQRAAQSMVDHLGAAFARIWTWKEDSDELILRASAGLYTHLDGEHRRIPVGQYKIGRIAKNGAPHLTNQVLGDSEVHDQEWAEREGMISFAGYPLRVRGQTLGVMAMFSRSELSESTTTALGDVAGSVALGIYRLRIEADLRDSVLALRRADQSKDEFLAMLSHELRAPLAPMRNALEILKLGESRPDLIQVLDEQLDHSSRLVDDLLDISRVSRGKIVLQLGPTSIEELVGQSSRSVQRLVEERRQRFSVVGADGCSTVRGDPFRLRQVLMNLLQNAAKYTPEGGRIELQVVPGDDSVEVRVEDDGIGIEPSFLPHVFDLFAQSGRSLDRREGGLGLGLTLARSIIEGHGGEIGVHSEGVGKGSCFWFRLPLVERRAASSDAASEPATTAGAGESASPLSGRRTLVVDDNEAAADTLRELLLVLGCREVAVAYDGRSALDIAAQATFDLVVLDIGLPGLDGYELARRLRALEGLEDTILVALTGYGSNQDRERSRQAGFDLHLTKPLDLGAFEKALATRLGQPGGSGDPTTS